MNLLAVGTHGGLKHLQDFRTLGPAVYASQQFVSIGGQAFDLSLESATHCFLIYRNRGYNLSDKPFQ
jgi:hypothetical protein